MLATITDDRGGAQKPQKRLTWISGTTKWPMEGSSVIHLSAPRRQRRRQQAHQMFLCFILVDESF